MKISLHFSSLDTTSRLCKFIHHIWVNLSRHTAQEEQEEEEQQEMSRVQAANMYRQRRHISTEDTISLGGDSNGASAEVRRQDMSTQVSSLRNRCIEIPFLFYFVHIYQ